MKRLISMMVAVTLILTSCGGSNTKPAATTPTDSSTASSGQENTKTGGTLRILSENSGGHDADEMAKFEQALGDALGCQVSIEMPPSDYQNLALQKLQSGEKYDLISCTQLFYLNIINQGAAEDLTDKIKSSQVLSQNVEQSEWDAIAVDGKIYAGFNKKEVHKPVLVNKVHLEKAGIDYKNIPPTLDGYYDVFKKLKSTIQTPNYYPLNIVLKQVNNLQPWMASAGLKTGVVKDADGKNYVPISTDAAAPVWDWLHKLYAEELLDPACLVDSTSDLRAKMSYASQFTSVAVDWAAFVGLHNAEAEAAKVSLADYEIASTAGPNTPDGSHMLTKGAASLWVIPTNAENPEAAFKALEYFATQEGGELLSAGVKDYDYTVDASGKYTETEMGLLHKNDHGAPIPIDKDFKFPFGLATGMEEALSTGVYATIEMPTDVQKDYEEVVGKWGGQIVKGEVDTKTGLENMRSELLSRGVTEK